MATKYSQIPPGSLFEAGGGKFRKVDDLYYEDVYTGFEAMWNPMFDETLISVWGEKEETSDNVNTTDKFIVNQQNRLVKPNPNYQSHQSCAASRTFAEMWGTAEFDCGPEDYDFMALQSVQSVLAMKSLAKLLNLEVGKAPNTNSVPNLWAYSEIVKAFTAAYEKYHDTPENVFGLTLKEEAACQVPAAAPKKRSAKKAAKKTPAKKTAAKKKAKK